MVVRKCGEDVERNEKIVTSIVASVMMVTTAQVLGALDLAYLVDEQALDIQLQTDGSALVAERIRYSSFHASNFQHRISLLDYEISDLTVSLYEPTQQAFVEIPQLSDELHSHIATYYRLEIIADEVAQIQLYNASDERHLTFQFTYRIDNLVATRHPETTELIMFDCQEGLLLPGADITGRVQFPRALPQLNQQHQPKVDWHSVAQAAYWKLNSQHDALRFALPAHAQTTYSALQISLPNAVFDTHEKEDNDETTN